MYIPEHMFDKLMQMNLAGRKYVPDNTRILRAFSYFPLEKTKVIIIGQDPYPNRKDASGLAFSVEHENYPPSLRNIFKELNSDLGLKGLPKTGNLEAWAKQGVLLINTILTTDEGKSLAHKEIGWESFVKEQLQLIFDKGTPVVVIAWGTYAQKFLNSGLQFHNKILFLNGGHPSPLNTKGGFFGGQYFSRANEWLKKFKVKQINWRL